MENEIKFSILVPFAVSFVVPMFWLLNQSILIAYKKKLLKEGIAWLNNKPILLPTLAVFILPVITVSLSLHQIPDILKFILPLITFIGGQFIGRYEKKDEIINRQIEVFLILKRKLSINHDKIIFNQKILLLELDLITNNDKGFVERRLQFVDRIIEDFTKLDTLLILIGEKMLTMDGIFAFREMSKIIDDYNEIIEQRKDYIEKCRGYTTNSVEQHLNLLESTDRELLKLTESFKKTMNDILKVDLQA